MNNKVTTTNFFHYFALSKQPTRYLMKDVFGLIKSEIPNFFLNFVNILSAPRTHLLRLLYKSGSNKEEAIARALTYYFLCLVLTAVFSTPIYGVQKTWNILPFTYSFIIPTILVILSALSIRIAWKILRRQCDYFDLFILLSYQMGTLFTIYLFTNFVNLSILKYLNPETYAQVIQYSFLNNKAVDPYENILSNSSLQIYGAVGFIALISVICWFYYGWQVFRIKANGSKVESFIAMVIFTILMIPVFFIDMAMAKLIE